MFIVLTFLLTNERHRCGMDRTIEQLLEIQDKDIRIFNLKMQIESVPEEKEKVKHLMSEAEDAMNTAKNNYLDIEKNIKNEEIEIASLKDKILNLQNKSASIKKNDEYKAVLKEIKQFNEKIEQHEDKQLVFWEKLEESKASKEKAAKNLEATKSRIENSIRDLDTRNENCKIQIEKVKEVRQSLSETIPPELFNNYLRLLKRRSSGNSFVKAVVPLQGENCGGCFLKVTPQIKASLRKSSFDQCENCGVILYLDV